MVRRIRLSAFLPVESTPLGITETGDPGVPADISRASGAGWIAGVAAESMVGAGVLARGAGAGGGATGLGVRLMEAATCRGSEGDAVLELVRKRAQTSAAYGRSGICVDQLVLP